MEQLQLFLAYGGFWTTLILAIVLALSPTPKNANLRNYNRAKYIMVASYLLFSVFNIFIFSGALSHLNLTLQKIIILVLFLFQLYFFTHVSLTLINYHFFSVKLLLYQFLPIIILALVCIKYCHPGESGPLTRVIFHAMVFFFVIALFTTSRFFVMQYRKYRKRVENYFTDVTINKLRWVHVSYLFLIVGGIVVLIAIFTSLKIVTPFYFFAIIFYIGYAIHFLNYKNIFPVMKVVLSDDNNNVEQTFTPRSVFERIETALSDWESKKLFTSQKITITKVASQISTNRSYLSQYINQSKQKTFNEWINELRIQYAKELIQSGKYDSIDEISDLSGYTDKSYFQKCFAKYAGTTVSQWKEACRATDSISENKHNL